MDATSEKIKLIKRKTTKSIIGFVSVETCRNT